MGKPEIQFDEFSEELDGITMVDSNDSTPTPPPPSAVRAKQEVAMAPLEVNVAEFSANPEKIEAAAKEIEQTYFSLEEKERLGYLKTIKGVFGKVLVDGKEANHPVIKRASGLINKTLKERMQARSAEMKKAQADVAAIHANLGEIGNLIATRAVTAANSVDETPIPSSGVKTSPRFLLDTEAKKAANE